MFGFAVGLFVGVFVGQAVGLFLGALVGLFVGLFVGALVGLFVRWFVGWFVGALLCSQHGDYAKTDHLGVWERVTVRLGLIYNHSKIIHCISRSISLLKL